MTDTPTTYGSQLDESRERLVTSIEAPALITEQQVLFSTAAAVALPPAKTRRWSDAVHAASAVGSWIANAAKPSTKPVYPKRYAWLENASMSREMDRL